MTTGTSLPSASLTRRKLVAMSFCSSCTSLTSTLLTGLAAKTLSLYFLPYFLKNFCAIEAVLVWEGTRPPQAARQRESARNSGRSFFMRGKLSR